MAVDVEKLLAKARGTLAAAKAVEEQAETVLHPEVNKPPARWSKRRGWGQPKHRQPAKRHVDTKARPLARCRRLPGRRRVRRVRRFTGPSGHRRRSDAELRKLLAQGAFAGWVEQNVRSALESTDRAVIICASPSCSGMSMVQRDKAAETWAKHCKTHVHQHGERHERLTVPGLSGTKRHRRRMLRQVRRSLAANATRGLLGQVRAHAAEHEWKMADLGLILNASRFWVGGTGNWDAATTTQWSATSGGAGGASVPTATDDVTFDGASGGGTVTITATANGLSFNAAAFTGAFILNAGIIIVGNVTLPTAAITFTGSFGFTISGACTFTSNGCTLTGGLSTQTGVSNITFADASRVNGTVTLSFGTINTNNQTCTWGIFSSSNTNARTLTLGSSAITLAFAGTAWSAGTTTNMTFSGASSTITLSGASASFGHASTAGPTGAFGSVLMTGSGAPSLQITTSSMVNFTRTGTAVKTDSLIVTGNPSITGSITLTGNSVTNRLLVGSGNAGTARFFNVSNTVTQTINNVDFGDGGSNGTGTLAGTSIGDAGGNTGVTFTGAVTRFRVAAGNWSDSNWSTTTGGGTGASVPLPQDTVNFDGNSGVGTVTADMPRLGANLTFTGYTGTVAFSSTANSVYGNLTLASGMTISGTQALTLSGRGAQTLTSSTRQFTQSVTIAGPSGTYTLQDAFSVGNTLFVSVGTFAANGQTVSATALSSSNSVVRVIQMGSGAWSLTQTAAIAVWTTATATNLTLTVSTAVVSCTGAPGGAITATVTTGGVTMPSFTVNGGANLTVQFSDAFTTAGTITLTQAKLDTNNQTVSALAFSSTNSNTRALTLGSTAMTLTGAALGTWDTTTATGMTLTAGTSTITFVPTAGGSSYRMGTLTYASLVMTISSSGGPAFSGSFTSTNFTITGAAIKTSTVSFNVSTTYTINGALTLTGNSVTNRLLVQASIAGTTTTIALGASATAKTNSSNVDFQDITMSGGAANERDFSAITGKSGDALGNTGITFTTGATQFWFSGTGNWSDSSKWFLATAGGGGAGRVPLPQDAARFDGSSFTAGSQTVTTDMPRAAKDMTWTGVTNTPAWAIGSGVSNPAFYGNLTMATMVRGTWPAAINLSGRSSQTITSAGFVQFAGVVIIAVTGTYTLADAFTNVSSAAFNVSSGTFDGGGFSVSSGTFASSSGNTRTVTMGSGAWSLTTASSLAAWSTASASLTLTVTNNTTSFTGTAGSNTITTGGVTMPNVTFNGAGGTWTNSDAFTTVGTITLTAGTWSTGNQTIGAKTVACSGSTTRTLTLGSSAITLSANSGADAVTATTATALTITSNTATITMTGDGVFRTAGVNWNGLSLSYTSVATPQLTTVANATFANVTRTGTALKTDGLDVGGPFTATGTLTASGNSTTNRLFFTSHTIGTPITVTVAAVSLTNVDFRDITTAGAAGTWTGTSLGDALGNSGITFTAPVTRFGVVAGNWSNTATWSATTGGAGGASVPLPQDTVTLDASSAAGTYTGDMPRAGKDIICTGFTRTLTMSTSFAIYGSVTLASGMTFSGSGGPTFSGRSSHTITSAGKSFATANYSAFGGTYTLQDAWLQTGSANITLNNGTLAANNQTVSGTSLNSFTTNTRALSMGTAAWSLSSAWNVSGAGLTLTVSTAILSFTATSGTQTVLTGGYTMPNLTENGAGGTTQFSDAFTTAGTITLTSGTLDTNSKAVSCSVFSLSNSNTRTLTMGSTALTASFSGTAWDAGTNTSLTVTANTATATLSGASAIFSSGGGVNWNGLSVVLSGSGTQAIRGGSTGTFANVTRTGTAVKTDGVQFGQSSTMTVTGTLTITGNSITNRVLVSSTVLGTARTISAATVVSTNADWQDITAAGAASWDLSAASGGSGDALGNTGITFTTLQTNYYKAAALDNFSTTAKWFLATNGGGGAGRVPLPQDTAVFDGSSGGFAYTMDMPRFGTLTATGFTGTLAFSSVATTTFGNLTLGSATLISGTQTTSLGGRGGQTLTSSGRTFTQTLSLVAFGGTYTQQDAFVGASLTWTNGTWAANNQNVAATNVQSTGAVTRAVTMGSGTWSLTSTSAITVWSVSATLTVTPGTSTITISTASASSRTFAGAGLTYGTLSYTVAASTGPLLLTGANVFTALTVTSEAGNAKTLTLPSATTTTVTTLTLTGASGSLLTLNSSTPTSAATISVAGIGSVSAQYLTITDSAATGGASFVAFDSIFNSDVSGWIFGLVSADNAVGDDAILSITLSASESASAVDAISMLTLSSDDTAAAVDDLISVTPFAFDVGTAADDASLIVVLSDSESAAAVDVAALIALISVDTASGVETTAAGPISADSATAVDSGALIAVLSSFDTAAVTDTASIVATLSAADTAVAVDAMIVGPHSNENATAVDAVSTIGPITTETASASDVSQRVALISVDSAVGDESVSKIAPTRIGDDAAGADRATMIALAALDIGAAVDSQTALTLSSADSSVGVDAVRSLAVRSLGDSGSGVDRSTSIELAALDAAAAAESSRLLAALSSIDNGNAVDVGTRLGPISADSATAVDAQTLAALLASADTGAGVERVSLALASADTGVGGDSDVLSVRVTAGDTSAATDDVVRIALRSLDAATGIDRVLALGIASIDSAGGLDSSQQVGLDDDDAASVVDVGAALAALSSSDSAHSTETTFVAVSLTSSDEAAASDVVIRAALFSGDTASGTEATLIVEHVAIPLGAVVLNCRLLDDGRLIVRLEDYGRLVTTLLDDGVLRARVPALIS